MNVDLPVPALVLLVGPSGSGKSTFAAAHFAATEVISSDALRGMLTDDAADQGASAEAFRILALLANGRLKRRLTTVIDATNLRAVNRHRYRQLAGRYGVPVVVVAFDLPPELFAQHNRSRRDRIVADDVIADQAERMTEAMTDLVDEDYEALFVIRDADTLRGLTVSRRGATP